MLEETGTRLRAPVACDNVPLPTLLLHVSTQKTIQTENYPKLARSKTVVFKNVLHQILILRLVIQIGIWTAFGSTDIVADSTYSDST